MQNTICPFIPLLSCWNFVVSGWDGLDGHKSVERQMSVSSDSKLLDEDIRDETRVILRPKKPPRPKSEMFLNKDQQARRTKRFSAFGVSIFKDICKGIGARLSPGENITAFVIGNAKWRMTVWQAIPKGVQSDAVRGRGYWRPRVTDNGRKIQVSKRIFFFMPDGIEILLAFSFINAWPNAF